MNHFTTSVWLVHPLCATVLFLMIVSSTLSGCTARLQPATVAVVAEDDLVVDAAPVNVYAYPHTDYRGSAVYFVNGRWYRSHGNRWYYYRSEPPALARQRPYVQQAPPAPRAPGPYVQQAPPAPRAPGPYVQQAPPAPRPDYPYRRTYDRRPHDRRSYDRHPYGGGPRP